MIDVVEPISYNAHAQRRSSNLTGIDRSCDDPVMITVILVSGEYQT